MKTRSIYIFLAWFILLMPQVVKAQTTVGTTSSFTGNNGSGTVVFNLQNSNSSAVVLTTIKGIVTTTGTTATEVWYKTSAVNGVPGAITTTNGWTQIATGTFNSNGSATALQTFFSNINFSMPASTTYGFAVYAAGQRYFTMPTTPATQTFTAGGISIITGASISYGGGAPNGAAPTFTPRGWVGEITFVGAAACTGAPTGTSTSASDTLVCSGAPTTLDVAGLPGGTTGFSFQLQSSATVGGTYTNLGTSQSSSTFTINPTTNRFYRVSISCSTTTATSTPIQVRVNPNLPGGTYTINAGAAASSTNFVSFNAAANALSCGIAGPVIMNVVANSGPYNEQVEFPEILGTSATNTITINGNGNTLTYNSTNSADRAGILLNGADYFRINNLIVAPTGTYGYAIHLTNNADNNIISGCTVNNLLTNTSSFLAGIVISGSLTSATSANSECDSNTIINNTVNGGYYAITNLGKTSPASSGNTIKGNTIKDFYYYGIYTSYNDGLLIDSNDISRPNRSTVSTFYGLYMSTGLTNCTVSRNRIHNTNGASTTSTSQMTAIYTNSDGTVGNENMVVNNLIYDFNGSGTIYALYNAGGDHVKYLHNTVSLDNISNTSANITRGFYQTTAATGVEIRNNIFTMSRTGTGANTILYFNTPTSTINSNYNDLYLVPNSGSSNFIGRSNTTDYTTLAAWQGGTSFGTNSVSVDPLYVSVATGNLKPNSFPLDNKGVAAGITKDITNASRSTTTPDIGAYEFVAVVPCNAPSGLTATTVLSSTATISWNVATGATSYRYVVSTSNITPSIPGTNTTATSVALTGLLSGTTYYYFVRSQCGGPSTFSPWSMDSFTTCTPPPASIAAVGAVTFCQGDSVKLNANTGTGYTYQFSRNNTAITGATNASYTAVSSGNYRVKVTGPSGCSTTSAPVAITVNPLPTATLTPGSATTFCIGNSVVLSANTGTGFSYQYFRNDSLISGASASSITASTTGRYRVKVINNNGCSDTSASVFVTVNPLPVATLTPSGNVSICQGRSVTLSANTGTGLVYAYFKNNVIINGATSSTYVATSAGTYKVRVTNANGCSRTSATVTVAVLPSPTATLTAAGPTTFCAGGSVVLNANTGTGLSYQFFRNNVLLPTTTSAHTAIQAGTFKVVVTNAGGCRDTSATITVIRNPLPTAIITPAGSTSFCDGADVTLNANTGAGLSYQWKKDTVSISGATSSSFIASTSGNYTVKVTNASGCSKTSNGVAILVNAAPTVSVLPTNAAYCSGDSVALTATSNTMYFQWYKGNTAILGAESSTYFASQPGVYSVVAISFIGCTETSNPVTVIENPAPNPSITLVGNTFTTTAFSSYQWNLNGSPIAGANAASHQGTQAGIYTVTVTDAIGCRGTSGGITLEGLSVTGPTTSKTIEVYPNPTTGIVNIRSAEDVDVLVMGMDGKIVAREVNAKIINLSAQANGMYMIRIADKNGNTIYNGQFMKKGI